MTPTPKFEAVIRDWRTRCGLSQSEAAHRLNVPLKTFQKWDQGVTAPDRWRLELLTKKMAQIEKRIKP